MFRRLFVSIGLAAVVALGSLFSLSTSLLAPPVHESIVLGAAVNLSAVCRGAAATCVAEARLPDSPSVVGALTSPAEVNAVSLAERRT